MDRRPIGSCGKPHGLRGEVAVYTAAPDAFRPGTSLLTSHGRTLTVSEARPHKNHLLVLFDEVGDRTAAESLRNVDLSIAAADRPPLDEDEFWASDLIGLEVRDNAGNPLGEVSDVVSSAVQDRLVVTTPDGSVEVPFVPDIVTTVAEDHVVVDPPEGLLDPTNDERQTTNE